MLRQGIEVHKKTLYFVQNGKPTLVQLHKESGKCILRPYRQPVDAPKTNVPPYGMTDFDIQDINDHYECK